MSATVISPDGTWTGTTGKATSTRPVRADDQFAIGSVTKSVVAAQVMQLVEAGELELDDPVDAHLSDRFDFDTNHATIRDLLGHRSGIPDYDPFMLKRSRSEPLRRWSAEQLLRLVPEGRTPAGRSFEYSSTNYLLLGLVIERLTGQSLSTVLRAGVLRPMGTSRLIYQPDEAPTAPIAMPGGRAAASLERAGGFLPSLANATGGGPAAAMASDSPSLARWWRALCAGEIVSQESLNQMTTWKDDYGLGLFDVAEPYADSMGHVGWDVGYASWAGCLPETSTVVVVLANREVDDLGGMAHPLVLATLAE
jgi:CubicO group peptidase (beta-lactamase class C family)